MITGAIAFLKTGLGKIGIAAIAVCLAYGAGVLRGRLVEARVTGVAFTAAQLKAKDLQIQQLTLQSASNASESKRLADELETSDENYQRLAQSLDTAGTCQPFTADELREFNALLGYGASRLPESGRHPDKRSGAIAEVAGLDTKRWALACARQYNGARTQLRSMRRWFDESPQFKRPEQRPGPMGGE